MRQIKLTHQEIETIKTALQYVYDVKIAILNQNRKIMSKEEKAEANKQAAVFFDTQDIFDGERDV